MNRRTSTRFSGVRVIHHMSISTSVPLGWVDRIRAAVEVMLEAMDGVACAFVCVGPEFESACVIATSADAVELHSLELGLGDGPSITAFRTARLARTMSRSHLDEWPDYTIARQKRGIYSVAAFPIAGEGRCLGVLSIASSDHYGFGAVELRLGRALAADVSLLVLANDSI